jgi:hypothetical protein
LKRIFFIAGGRNARVFCPVDRISRDYVRAGRIGSKVLVPRSGKTVEGENRKQQQTQTLSVKTPD